MIRLLIADDEPKIREGLRDIINGFQMGIEICGEAKNGQQAIEMARERHPDIIIADISMPKLSGIEFISLLRKENTDCRVVIITGYDKFDYARQAISLGVSNYLLKPIVEQELRDTLKKLIDEIEQSSQEQYF